MLTNGLLMTGLLMVASESALRDVSFTGPYDNTSEWTWHSLVVGFAIQFVYYSFVSLGAAYIIYKCLVFLKTGRTEGCNREGRSIDK